MFDKKDTEEDVTYGRRFTARAEAIAEGALVDVTDVGHLLGFKLPIALTDIVFSKCVLDSSVATEEDETERVREILKALQCRIARSRGVNKASLDFEFFVKNSGQREATRISLKGFLTLDELGDRVITITSQHGD